MRNSISLCLSLFQSVHHADLLLRSSDASLPALPFLPCPPRLLIAHPSLHNSPHSQRSLVSFRDINAPSSTQHLSLDLPAHHRPSFPLHSVPLPSSPFTVQLLLLLDPSRLLLRQSEARNAHQTRRAERVQLDALSLPRGDDSLHFLRLRLALHPLAFPLSRLRVGEMALGPRVTHSGECERRKEELWNLRAAFVPAEMELNPAKMSDVRASLTALKRTIRDVDL